MRNQIGIILFVFVLVSSVFGGVYSGGAGEPNEPFIIATANDLQQIAYEPDDWDKCFKMVADVNLAELGRNFDIIAGVDRYSYFSGVFDGNGHTISNFKCDACDVTGGSRFGGVGVFYSIQGETAEVKNLGIINADVNGLCDDGYTRIGTLAGSVVHGAKVTNCYAENCKVKNGSEVGGLVGVLFDEGVLSNCYTTWDVMGNGWSVGGLVGEVYVDCIIENCYTTCNVSNTSSNSDWDAVGGLVGRVENGQISNCYSTGVVSGNAIVGGLVGNLWGRSNILDCYATGDVNTCCKYEGWAGWQWPFEMKIGGLIGRIEEYSSYSEIINCYARGDVNCCGYESYAGGLIGAIIDGSRIIVKDCSAAGDVNCCGYESYAGGLIGAITDGYEIVVKDCSATGDISLIGNSEDLPVTEETYSGGLVGYNCGAEIKNSYATGDVEGFDYVGGLVGWYAQACRDCTITNCYAMGDVNGVDYVGGFAGYAVGEIYDSYSSGEVNGGVDVNNVGGFVGLYECGYHGEIIDDCFWDIESSEMAIGVGFVDGELSEPLDIQGKTTAEMKSGATFIDAGWDFINAWGIGENQTYPYLRQYSAADISRDGVVNFADFAILADRWLE